MLQRADVGIGPYKQVFRQTEKERCIAALFQTVKEGMLEQGPL